MRSVPRCTTHNQDLAEARTRDFRKVHPGTPGLERLSKMLSTVCLRISRCMTCQSVWVSVSYTNASFVWAFCRTFDCRQGSAGGSFSSATCTHDAPSLCNLKKFVTRRLLYRAQISHLSKKPEETRLHINFCEIAF
jgi:hypothetical protein